MSETHPDCHGNHLRHIIVFIVTIDLAVYEIMWKNFVEPCRLQMTLRRMRFACRLLTATNSQSEYVIILTPWSRVLLEKLASLQLVRKFPAFYGTRRFLTALASARHLSNM